MWCQLWKSSKTCRHRWFGKRWIAGWFVHFLVYLFQNLKIQRAVGRAKGGSTFPLSIKLSLKVPENYSTGVQKYIHAAGIVLESFWGGWGRMKQLKWNDWWWVSHWVPCCIAVYLLWKWLCILGMNVALYFGVLFLRLHCRMSINKGRRHLIWNKAKNSKSQYR